MGIEDSSSVMGIHDYQQEVDRSNSIQIDIWIRYYYADGIYSTKPAHGCIDKTYKGRHSRKEAVRPYGIRIISFFHMFPSTSTEST
jgi:hypothetical protein